MISTIKPYGELLIEHVRDGVVIDSQRCHNDVTNIGLDTILGVMFASGTQVLIASWFMSLITGAGMTPVAADTMAVHAGWTEITDAQLTEAARPVWLTGDAVASQSLTNAAAVEFTISATCTVQGMFLTSVATLEGLTGILWATARFGSAISAIASDVIKVTYTIGAGV